MLLRIIIYFGVLIIISCKQNKTVELRDRHRSDSMFAGAAAVYFSNDQTLLALDTVQKLYQSLKKPTFWDKLNYYAINGVTNSRALGKFVLATNYFDTLINIIESGNIEKISTSEYAGVFIEKAYAYYEMAQYDKAINYYFKAEDLLKNRENDCEKSDLIHAIAMVLYKQKDFDQAKIYFKKELEIIHKCKASYKYFDPSTEQQSFNNIGLSFYKLKQYDSAKTYFLKALQFIEKNKYHFRKNQSNSIAVYYSCKGVVLGNLAKIFVEHQNFDSAVTLYQQAILCNSPKGYEKGDAQICRLQLAELYYRMGDFNNMKLKLNEYKTEKTKAINVDADIDWLRLMSLYFNKNNDYKNEVAYYKHYINKRDSVNALKNISQFTTITKELENKQQKLQINLLQKDNQLSKLYLIFIASGFLLVVFTAYLLYKNNRKEKKNLRVLTHLNNEIGLQQKATEEALQQVKASNLAKDKILNVVAHDLRNPIGAIANFLDIIQTKYDHPEAETKILHNSQQAAIRSLHLINDLLEVNKIQAGEWILVKVNFDVLLLLEQSIELVQYKTISKQQSIKLSTTLQNLMIEGDEEKLQRVFVNILDNAIKFSYFKAEIIVKVFKFDNYIQIQIVDYGVGMPLHLQEHLFTNSVVVKRKGTNNEPSNGLGLTICKQIIEAHNGKIYVNSVERRGTTFYIELPLV